MKKLIYSLALVLAGLTSCTSFDDPVTENYGAGPAVDVNVTAAIPTDSAFTITITPAAGSVYYAYIIDQNDEAEEIDGYTLLKGGYGNTVVSVEKAPTTTLTIDDADPNTTYQVYAVAANDKGVIGDVVVKSITTTDGLVPGAATISKKADDRAVTIGFTEALVRGEGAVTAKYYKEWDILNPVDVDAENITVEVSGKNVTFAAADVPDGAYLCFSWEEGAFKDLKGNNCEAQVSGLNMNTGKFTGAWVRATSVPFEISDDYITTPADGALIAKTEDFKGEIKFPFDIYRNDEVAEEGDLCVTYTGAKRSVTYKLAVEDWDVKDSTITFVLPAAPAGGDVITVSVVEGAVADVYGNLNTAFTSKTSWLFFAPTKDMVLGSFDMVYTSAYDEEPTPYSGGTITIEEDPEVENGIIVKNLFDGGMEAEGHLDLENAKVIIDALQIVAEDEYQGEKIYLVLYNLAQTDEIALTINPDGTLTTDEMGLVAYKYDLSGALGWWEKCSTAVFTPAKAEASRAFKAVRASSKKVVAAKRITKTLRK